MGVKSHLTVKHVVEAGFKAEWIAGYSWAEKLADEAMHELVKGQGTNCTRGEVAGFGVLGVKEPLINFTGHNVVA